MRAAAILTVALSASLVDSWLYYRAGNTTIRGAVLFWLFGAAAAAPLAIVAVARRWHLLIALSSVAVTAWIVPIIVTIFFYSH